jgi:hypothetical protein
MKNVIKVILVELLVILVDIAALVVIVAVVVCPRRLSIEIFDTGRQINSEETPMNTEFLFRSSRSNQKKFLNS